VSRIFRALERAEAEGKRASARDLLPSRDIESAPELDLPELRGEYARLKTMLALAANGSEQKSIMFVSVLSGEGASTITLGFACAAVEAAPQGVLVVDANFRRPALAGRLGVTAKVGLSELLLKEVTTADAILATPVQRLLFLDAGRRPLDVSRGRTRVLLEELLADLNTAFDYIVLDGGAVRGSSESLFLASRVDAVALVIQAGRTGMDAARDATRQLRKAGANVVGTILNRHREYLPTFITRRL
jgi:Mrp family chromosome partitioning ATPase